MSHSNGKISKPVQFEDIKLTLGTGANGIGQLCTSALINKWSLRKPIRFNKWFELTEADFFSANFGYTIPSYNNFNAMKAGATNGWDYLKPRGLSYNEQFRTLDFNGYDHNATAPFALELTNGNPRLADVCRISTPTDIVWLTNWEEWKGYQGTSLQYLNCGVYVPGVGYYPFTDTDQGLSIGDLDISKLNFTIDEGKFTVGSTYKVYLVLTTWDGRNGGRQWYNPAESEGGIWWVLATDQPLQFTVLKKLSPFDSITFSGSGTGTLSEISGYYGWRNVSINFSVKVASDYNYQTGTLRVDVIIPQHYPGSGTQTQSKTILTSSIPNVVAGFSQSYTKAASDFNLLTSKEDSVNANVKLTMQIGTETYTSTANLMITSI